MERLQPSFLAGPRIYFIEFDPSRTKTIKNRSAWKDHVSGRLKTLLLTKRSIVCGASHLRTPIVFDFLRENACLLEQSLLTPALRSDVNSVSDYVRVRGLLGREMRSFLSDSVHSVVSWEHEFNAAGFRDNLIRAMEDEASLLRMNLPTVPQEYFKDIADRLRNIHFLSRGSLDDVISPLDKEVRHFIRRFADLIYYCSGARTVNCETAIREIDYLDFSISVLLGKRSGLTEEMVFWKIFVEQVLQSLHLPPIPLESLHLITFDEVIKARAPLLDSGFCETYDKLLTQALEPIPNSQGRLAFLAERLTTLRDNIEKTFRDALPPQLGPFLKEQKGRANKKIAWSSASFGLGLLGMIPVAGIGFSILGSGIAGRDLYMTVQKARSIGDAPRARQLALEKIIATSDFEEKSILYEVVRYIGRILATRFWF